MKRVQIAAWLLFVPLLWFPAGGYAAPEGETLLVQDLPPVQGEIVKGVRYRDATGDNLVLLSETERFQRKTSGGKMAGWSRELHAGRLLLEKDGTVRRVWEMADHVYDCEEDITAAFILDAVRITDLDHDGTSEIWLPYVLGCRGDIGPLGMKILMYEGGAKHVVRGRTRVSIGKGESVGGECTFDDAFLSDQTVFRDVAARIWSDHVESR